MSMAQKIRDYQQANPTATAKQVAMALNTKPVTVHQTRWLDKQKQKKAAVKQKPKQIKTTAAQLPAPRKGDSVVRNELLSLSKKIGDLQQQNVQFRTVISYLEYQLGLKDSQDGAANGASV